MALPDTTETKPIDGGWIEVESLSKFFKPTGFEEDDAEDEETGAEDDRADEPDGTADPEGVWALKDVSFTLEPGERMAVLGPPGAGKTTLIKILSGVTLPTTGEVRGSGGRVPLTEVRTPMSAGRTVRSNLMLLETLLGLPKDSIRERLAYAAKLAEAEPILERKASKVPKALYSRLATTVALLSRPEIILIDDPLMAAGDRKWRLALWALFERSVKEGATLLMTCNSIPKKLDLCTKAIWLSKGRIITKNTGKNLISIYHSFRGPRLADDDFIHTQINSSSSTSSRNGGSIQRLDAGDFPHRSTDFQFSSAMGGPFISVNFRDRYGDITQECTAGEPLTLTVSISAGSYALCLNLDAEILIENEPVLRLASPDTIDVDAHETVSLSNTLDGSWHAIVRKTLIVTIILRIDIALETAPYSLRESTTITAPLIVNGSHQSEMGDIENPRPRGADLPEINSAWHKDTSE